MRVEAYSAVNRIYQSGAASSAKKGGSTASYSDKLEISRTAKDYQTAKEAVSRTSEVREDKVAQIKAAMEAGTYRVSAQEVAGKMLENIATLIDVLGQEDAEYKKLLELSNNKTKAIVGADIERLQDILVQEQAQIDAINKLEQQRMENVDDICNVLNLRRTDIKLEDILEVLKKQPKEHDALEAVNAQLKQTLNELMKINENNKLLTKESLDMVEFELNIAKNAVLTPQTGNYSKNAYDEERIQTVSGFDARQ